MTKERMRLLYLKILVVIFRTSDDSSKIIVKFADSIMEGIRHWDLALLGSSARIRPCLWELFSVSFQFLREFLMKSELTDKVNDVRCVAMQEPQFFTLIYRLSETVE